MMEKQKLEQALQVLREFMSSFVPLISITLGSGLGYMTELLEEATSISYQDIPNCPIPSATGHMGRLWRGILNGVPVMMLQGRVHMYEGRHVNEVVFLTRLMIMLAIKKLIITHATGSVTRRLDPCDIVGVMDQLPFYCPDPTSGPGVIELGHEFSPVDKVLNPKFLEIAKVCALDLGVSFHRGVSCWKNGRTFEGVAEGDMMLRMGGDVATMSTIPEVMAAAQMGIGMSPDSGVLDLALVTDMVANVRPPHDGSVSHEEVLAIADQMKVPFGNLITAIIPELARIE